MTTSINDVQVGQRWTARLGGRHIVVKILAIETSPRSNRRRLRLLNESSKREITRSASFLRKLVIVPVTGSEIERDEKGLPTKLYLGGRRPLPVDVGLVPKPGVTRCPVTRWDSGREEQCGLPDGHDGNHTLLIPTGMPWDGLEHLRRPTSPPPTPCADDRKDALEEAEELLTAALASLKGAREQNPKLALQALEQAARASHLIAGYEAARANIQPAPDEEE